jgi:hypothetical protein
MLTASVDVLLSMLGENRDHRGKIAVCLLGCRSGHREEQLSHPCSIFLTLDRIDKLAHIIKEHTCNASRNWSSSRCTTFTRDGVMTRVFEINLQHICSRDCLSKSAILFHPKKGRLKAAGDPFPSAAPMQKTFFSRAGRAIQSFAPWLEADAKITIP